MGDLLVGERSQISVHPGSHEVTGLDVDVTRPIRNRLLEHLIHQRRTLGDSRSTQRIDLFKAVHSESGTPLDSHTGPSLTQRLPSHLARPIGSRLQHTTHFFWVRPEVFGALTERSELTHEAVSKYSLAVDAPPGPGLTLLLDVRNEGRIRDQFVKREHVAHLGRRDGRAVGRSPHA